MNFVRQTNIKKITFPDVSNIGKFYRVIDNSYQECHQDGGNHYLAGTSNMEGQIVEIISKPFTKRYTNWNQELCWFIQVKCKKGFTHDTLYYKHGVIN